MFYLLNRIEKNKKIIYMLTDTDLISHRAWTYVSESVNTNAAPKS